MDINIKKEIEKIEDRFDNIQNLIDETQNRLDNLIDEQKRISGEHRFLLNKAKEEGLIDEDGNWVDTKDD